MGTNPCRDRDSLAIGWNNRLTQPEPDWLLTPECQPEESISGDRHVLAINPKVNGAEALFVQLPERFHDNSDYEQIGNARRCLTHVDLYYAIGGVDQPTEMIPPFIVIDDDRYGMSWGNSYADHQRDELGRASFVEATRITASRCALGCTALVQGNDAQRSGVVGHGPR